EKINDVINDIIHAQNVNPKTTNKTDIVFDEPNTPLFIFADKLRIYEVISNLITNAINATRNTSTDKVTVCARVREPSKNNSNFVCGYDANSYVIVSVKDSGTGIDPEIETRLFTKFVTKSESGLGLGLYISKCIVNAHDGKIWGQNNQDGKGATVSFSLPIETKVTSARAEDDL
ncbi:MAG TPA: HAMP domain-containing sensor histidine kinase, partial [Nitrososphaeraceae archaeon]